MRRTKSRARTGPDQTGQLAWPGGAGWRGGTRRKVRFKVRLSPAGPARAGQGKGRGAVRERAAGSRQACCQRNSCQSSPLERAAGTHTITFPFPPHRSSSLSPLLGPPRPSRANTPPAFKSLTATESPGRLVRRQGSRTPRPPGRRASRGPTGPTGPRRPHPPDEVRARAPPKFGERI